MSGNRAKRGAPFALAMRVWSMLAAPALLFGDLTGTTIPVLALLPAATATIFLIASAVAERALASGPAPGSIHAPPAPPRWTARLADPAPGQCPVCGMDDIAQLAAEDRDYGGERVVPYGRHLAHWDCAELVPHVAPRDRVEAGESPRSRRVVAQLVDAVPAGVPMLPLDRFVPAGSYVVGSSDERDWNLGPEFRVRIAGCTRTRSGFVAHLAVPSPRAAAAQQSLRAATTSSGFTQMWSKAALLMSCRICGDDTRCATEQELEKVVEQHRLGCWDGRTIAYAPRQR